LASTYVLRPLELYVLFISEQNTGARVRPIKAKGQLRSEADRQRFTEVSEGFRGEQSSGCETEFAQRRERGQRRVIYNIRTGENYVQGPGLIYYK